MAGWPVGPERFFEESAKVLRLRRIEAVPVWSDALEVDARLN
jgi:hypothetical protein